MLIAVSGGSGSGKTTTLKGISDYHKVIEMKTARSILEDWKTTLQQVYSDVDTTMKFQDELIRRKYDTETGIISQTTSPFVFSERTFADVFAFTVINLGKYAKTSKWLDEYYEKCMECQQIYSHVFYLKSGHFKVEKDGTRVENSHYVRALDLTMEDMTKQMTLGKRLTFIETPSLEQRVLMILTQAKYL